VLRAAGPARCGSPLRPEYLRLVWLTTSSVSIARRLRNRRTGDAGEFRVLAWPALHEPFIKTKASTGQGADLAATATGDFNAIAAERLGIAPSRLRRPRLRRFTARAASAHSRKWCARWRKTEMFALTADVTEALAGRGSWYSSCWRAPSGRPIMPFAMGDQPFQLRLNNWDRTNHQLPFGRGALVGLSNRIIVRRTARCRNHGKLRSQLKATLETKRLVALCAGRPSRNRRVMANSLPMTLRVLPGAVRRRGPAGPAADQAA